MTRKTLKKTKYRWYAARDAEGVLYWEAMPDFSRNRNVFPLCFFRHETPWQRHLNRQFEINIHRSVLKAEGHKLMGHA